MGDSRPHALLWKTEGGLPSRGGAGPPRTQGSIRKHSLSTTPVTGDQLKLFPREPEPSVTGQVPRPWIELLSSVTRKPIIGQIVYSQSWSHSGNSPRGSGRGGGWVSKQNLLKNANVLCGISGEPWYLGSGYQHDLWLSCYRILLASCSWKPALSGLFWLSPV